MVEGPASSDNSPQRLTVDSAASQIESLLPDYPSDKSDAVKSAPKKKAQVSAEPEQTELPDSPDESETPDEVDDSLEAGDNVDDENQQLEGDDEPDVDEDDSPEPRKFRVKVRGEEVEVTQDELLNGYSRQADYTRSKQELAQERAKFEKEELPAIRESAKKYAEGIAQIEDTLKAMAPAEPDWDKLAVEAPEDFARQRALWQLNQERVAAVAAERQRAAAEVQKHEQKARADMVRVENEALLEMVPEWKDNSKAKKEKSEIATYAKTLGLTDEDLQSVVKASHMVLLRNAYLYSKSLAKAPAIREKIERVKSATPGTNDNVRPGQKAQERRQQRLRRTGSVKDAAAVLENIPGLLDSFKSS